MTIKDIARESGYAVGTVSRALNNAPGVSAETRQKILEIVNRHNYEPNANAKHLKQQTNDGIALIVKGTQNMLFAGILEPLQQIIEESGYVATVYYIDEEANEVAQARRICTERKPHGILFLGSNPEYFTPELEALGIPCLLLTNSAASLRIRNLSSVSVDDMAASDTMIEYLYKKGHRRIGIIGGKPNLSRPSLARLAGCQGAMLRLGLPFDMEKQYAYARFSLSSGYEAMEYLLKHSPDITAVFAMSDLMALGAIRALRDHGLCVPQDISVTGFVQCAPADDHPAEYGAIGAAFGADPAPQHPKTRQCRARDRLLRSDRRRKRARTVKERYPGCLLSKERGVL